MKRSRGTLRVRARLAVAAAAACVAGLTVAPAYATYIAPWHSAEVLSPAGGGYAQLVAIACVGARPCVAAGSYSPAKPPGTREAMVAAESSKGRWSRAVLVKLPSNENATLQDATLSSVACPSARSCVAVGYYTWGSNNKDGLISTGHGATWSRGRTPVLPAGVAASEGAALSGVSCPKTGDCEAVGGWGLGSGQAMAEAMARGRWQRAVTIRPPANAYVRPAAYLSSVSCTAVGQCVAVGGYTDKTGAEVAMAALESKGKWGRAVHVGLPRGAAVSPTATLFAVGCAGKVTCEAAGDYTTSDNAQAAFVEQESRGRWRDAVQVASLPSGAQRSPSTVELGGISCSPLSCLAVGDYRDKAGALVPMTVLGSGRTWERAKSFGLPHGAAAGSGQSATLIAVTCDAADIFCTGVGDYTPVGGLATGATEAMAAAGGM
jgi:hypothetical protein